MVMLLAGCVNLHTELTSPAKIVVIKAEQAKIVLLVVKEG